MLVLTMKRGMQIDVTLEDGRRIEIVALDGDAVHFRLGFSAPKSILIDRHDITLRKEQGGTRNMSTDQRVWSLKRTAQCRKCPWLVDTNPLEIPNGYSEEKHRALEHTIAKPSDGFFGPSTVMACHETHDAHCIGWLVNQLGRGNNIGLRIRMMSCGNAGKIRLRGEQHECFEDTLPWSPQSTDELNARYDPMTRDELIAECERLRGALEE